MGIMKFSKHRLNEQKFQKEVNEQEMHLKEMSLDRKLDKVEKNVEGNVIQPKVLTKMGNSLQNQEIILIVKCSISVVKTLYHIFENP